MGFILGGICYWVNCDSFYDIRNLPCAVVEYSIFIPDSRKTKMSSSAVLAALRRGAMRWNSYSWDVVTCRFALLSCSHEKIVYFCGLKRVLENYIKKI